jgi:hypothetical protein
MQIANPNLIVQTQPLEERMNRYPKSPLKEIFEYNDLTGLGIGEAFRVRRSLASERLVMKHPLADEIIDGRFCGLRLSPLFLHHLGPFLRLSLSHPLPLSPL